MQPVLVSETTQAGQVRLVKRCPDCGWFFDATRIPREIAQVEETR
jgi:hypothetical protein